MIRAIGLTAVLAALLAATATASPTPSAWTLGHFNPQMNPVVPGPDAPVTWTFTMAAGTSATPTVANGTVYIASNDHTLYALDLLTGALRWKMLAGNFLMSAPLVYDGVVIVGEGDFTPAAWDAPHFMAIGRGVSADYGLDAASGKTLWYYGLPGTGMPTGAIVDGTYIRHDGVGLVIARDAVTGAFKWKTYVGSGAAMSAINVVNADEIVTSERPPESVTALRPSDGTMLWQHVFPPEVNDGVGDCPVATDGTRIYGMYLRENAPGSDTKTQHDYALDAKTGALLWDTAVEDGIAPPRNRAAIPMLYDGLLYDGVNVAPWVHAFDPATGKIVWSLHVAGPVKGGMVAKDGVVYFGDLDGYLWAVDAKSGSVIGSKKMADTFNVGSPIIAGNTLIIGGHHRLVFAEPLAAIRAGKDLPAP